MKEYNEQVVETLDDAGCIIANKNIIIDNLQARIAELEEEKRLLEDDCGYQMQWKREFREQLEYSQKQLAAEQLNNKLLRGALEAVIKVHGYESGIPVEALAQPSDTSALDVYVAEKVKEYQERLADALAVLGADSQIEAEAVMRNYKKQVSTLTKQRDLAVEAIRHCIAAMGSVTDVKKAMDWPQLHNAQMLSLQALDAIKESEGK